MAFWLPSDKKLYLPPSPVTTTMSTDAYVTRTPIYYHADSDRLLTVGHPYFQLYDSGKQKVTVPKVSSSQYRVFRVRLPDPNRFALGDQTLYNPEKERLVWALRGIEVGRGQPLGIGTTGHPLFNRFDDHENPGKYTPEIGKDNRQSVSFDPKQTQLFLVGCAPAIGEHWGKARSCDEDGAQQGSCPPIELVGSVIEDGDMIDTGFGNMDFKALQENRSDVPLDIVDSICKYPDYIKMGKDNYGDSLFFYARREQQYSRHFFSHAGKVGDAVPDSLVLKAASGQPQSKMGTSVYFGTPSGSLVTSEAQLFNRPYWLQRAQGQNNGICWENQLFVTVVDTTRGTNFTLSVSTEASPQEYDASKFNQYLRHVEEYDLSFIFQVCVVTLTPEVLAHLHTMNTDILETWNLGVNPPPANNVEDRYRYENSLATRCPDKVPPKERVDRYGQFKFWDVDISDRLSQDLDQFPLGRKFLLQLGQQPRSTRKRTLRIANSVGTSPAKRKRTRK